MIGWRYWIIGGEPPRLVSPMRNPSHPGHEVDTWDGAGRRRSRCRTGASHPPSPDCACGFRLVEDRFEILLWIQGTYRTFTERNVPAACPPLLIARVRGSGIILPGVDFEQYQAGFNDGEDPPGTWRAEYVEIIGPAFLSPAASRGPLPSGLIASQRSPSDACLLAWLHEVNDSEVDPS